jgi:hypothetical protein
VLSWKRATIQRELEHGRRGMAIVRSRYQETTSRDCNRLRILVAISIAKLHCGHHPLVFCDEYINFLLIAVCGDCSWSNAAKQIGDAPLSIFKVFHLTSHTAGTHTGITINMTKSINNPYYSSTIHTTFIDNTSEIISNSFL